MASEAHTDPDPADDPLPGGGHRRGESIQRLQIGLSGLAAMILLVSLASIIRDRVREAEAGAGGENAALSSPGTPPSVPAKDPLADAGVVPDIPAGPAPSATPAAGDEAVSARP